MSTRLDSHRIRLFAAVLLGKRRQPGRPYDGHGAYRFGRHFDGNTAKQRTHKRILPRTAFEPSPTSGLIAYKADFVSFLTRRSRKVLGFKHQDVRS
jgi:hypothetical protein